MTLSPPDPVYIIKGDMGPVHSLMFQVSPHTEYLYAGTESGKIHIWNLRNNRVVDKLATSNESCLALHTIREELLITQKKGGSIDFWRHHNSSWVFDKTFNTDYYGFCKSQKSNDEAFYIPMSDSKIGYFSINTCKVEIELDPINIENLPPLGLVMGMKSCFGKSTHVLAIYDGGQLCLWDIRSKKILSSLEIGKSPMSLEFNPSLEYGIIGSPSDSLEIFSLSPNDQLSTKTELNLVNPGTSAIAIRPDRKIFTTGGWDSRIRIYSCKSFKPLAVLDQHKETIHDIIFSNSSVEAFSTGYLMAVAGKEGYISLWNLYNS